MCDKRIERIHKKYMFDLKEGNMSKYIHDDSLIERTFCYDCESKGLLCKCCNIGEELERRRMKNFIELDYLEEIYVKGYRQKKL